MVKQIGYLTKRVIKLLNLTFSDNTPILIGDSNINHMKNKHPNDYAKYKDKIPVILNCPDYIRSNPKDNSIEYVKEFKIDNEYVKIAVRVSNTNQLFVRSLYVLNSNRVKNYIKKGSLIKY